MSRTLKARLNRLEARRPDGFVAFIQASGESREDLMARVTEWRSIPGPKPRSVVVFIKRNRREEQ